jgi:hypothetical protein
MEKKDKFYTMKPTVYFDNVVNCMRKENSFAIYVVKYNIIIQTVYQRYVVSWENVMQFMNCKIEINDCAHYILTDIKMMEGKY